MQLNLFVMAGAVVECPWDLLSCPCIAVTAGLTSSAVLLQERRLSIASGTGGAGVGVSSEAQMALEDWRCKWGTLPRALLAVFPWGGLFVLLRCGRNPDINWASSTWFWTSVLWQQDVSALVKSLRKQKVITVSVFSGVWRPLLLGPLRPQLSTGPWHLWAACSTSDLSYCFVDFVSVVLSKLGGGQFETSGEVLVFLMCLLRYRVS